MKTKTQKKKGISLIVLIITIIVMIILAAAIILSLNSSGIIEKANEAKAKTEAKQIEEQVKLAAMQTLAEANGNLEDAILKENLSSTFGTTGYGIIGDVTNGWIVTVPATNGQEYKITSNGLVTKITFKHTDTDNDGVLDVGELVTHESGEEFFVIGTEGNTVKLLSKYNLKVENNKVTLAQDKIGRNKSSSICFNKLLVGWEL